jgi:hypothetical protein
VVDRAKALLGEAEHLAVRGVGVLDRHEELGASESREALREPKLLDEAEPLLALGTLGFEGELEELEPQEARRLLRLRRWLLLLGLSILVSCVLPSDELSDAPKSPEAAAVAPAVVEEPPEIHVGLDPYRLWDRPIRQISALVGRRPSTRWSSDVEE